MGLDMYLTAKRYMWYNEDALKEQVAAPFDLPEGIKPKEVSVEAAYWRKANQIHKWFVDNVQNGKDECKSHDVSREELQQLLDVCKRIQENPELAEKLLPTQSGFFFGGTNYDEYYMKDIYDTVVQLERALQLEDSWYFEYCSSW
jgi:hypothetical protein